MSNDDDKNKAVRSIKEAWAILKKAKELGASDDKCAQSERYMKLARKAMRENDFALALENAKKSQMLAHNILAEADGGKDNEWINQLKELTEFMKTAQEQLQAAKEKGVPTADAEKVFSEAVRSMEAKQYEASRESFVQVVAMLKSSDKEYSKVKEFVLDAQLAVTDLKSMGINVLSIEALVNQALIALENGEYQKAIELSEDILKQCISITEKGKKAKKSIAKAEKAIKDAEAEGIEVKHLRDEIDVAKKAFEEKDFQQAQELADSLTLELTNNLSKHKQIAETVKWAHEKLNELRDMGIDTTKWYSSFSEALNLSTEHKYDEALEKLNLLRSALADIETNTNRIQELEKQILEIEKKCQNEGLDRDFSENIHKAHELIQSLEFHKAISLMETTARLTAETLENYTTAKTYLAECKRMMNALQNEEIEVEGVHKLLEEANNAFDIEDFTTASKKATEAKKAIEPLFMSYFKAKEFKEKVQTLVERAGGLKLLTDEQVAKINKMNGDFSIGNYVGSANTAEELIRTLEGEIADYRNVVEMVEDLKNKLNQARDYGIDVSKLEINLMTSLGYIENGQFKEATEIAKKVEEELMQLLSDFEEADSQIRLIRAKVRVMTRDGVNMESVRTMLEDAEKAFAQGDYGTVVSLSSEIINRCREIQENFSLSKRRLESARKQISDFESEGVNMNTVKEELATVEEYITKGNYSMSRKALEKVGNAIIDTKQSHMKVMEMLRGTWHNILQGARYGTVGMDEMIVLRDDIAALIKDGAYKEAIREIDHLNKLVGNKVHAAEIMYRYKKPITDTITRLKQRGIKISYNVTVDMERFEAALSVEDLPTVEKVGKSLMAELINLEREVDELVELVGTAQTKLSAARANGLPVEKAETLFKNVTASWKSGDFNRAKDGARKVIEILLKSELRRPS